MKNGGSMGTRSEEKPAVTLPGTVEKIIPCGAQKVRPGSI
jgi:hypothetical protein